MENHEFEANVIARLAVIESKLDRYTETEKTANEAHTIAVNNENDIKDLKDNNKWLKRAVITAIISAIFAILLAIVEKGVGLK